MYRQLPVGNSSWPSLWEGAGVTPAKGTSRWIGIRVPLVDMDSLLEMRPETRPRHLVSRWSECARAADSGSPRNPWVSWGGEHRSTRISNAYARRADPGSPRNPRFRGVGDGPGKGAPTQWGCNGPHPGPPRSLLRGVDGRQRSGRAFRPHLYGGVTAWTASASCSASRIWHSSYPRR